MENLWKLIILVCLMSRVTITSVKLGIDFTAGTEKMKKLPRFWTNTGFSPPEPVEHVNDFFMTEDLNLNLEIVGSLPNRAITNVRVHWLLNLIMMSNYSSFHLQPSPVFNFTLLDIFLWKLTKVYKLYPTIEIMSTLKFRSITAYTWEDFAYQLISRYIGQYGLKNVMKWKFETWNEPDVKGYNILNFTLEGYINEYMNGIKKGFKTAERQFGLDNVLKLRGPAGLFKNEKKHQFCWNILKKCNDKVKTCPIDIITFHRKGNGNNAKEILDGSFDLLKTFADKFPKLATFEYSNSEADPIKKWSEPREFQSDARYAVFLVETVLQHWQAMYDGRMKHLESISHDNSFLNFYPNIFTQRTLLARFQMNKTTPKHVQFVQKPVYSALGLLSSLAVTAGEVNVITNDKLSYVITENSRLLEFYSCILIWSHVSNLKAYSNKSKTFEIEIRNLPEDKLHGKLIYFVEGIDFKRTNPSAVYQSMNSPPFPDFNEFTQMKMSQNPLILNQPAEVSNRTIIINLQLMTPFVLTVRICSANGQKPRKVKNLRLRKINSEEIIIFWSDAFYRARCIKTYEVFFKYSDQRYKQVKTNHIPFMYQQLKHTLPGCFKIRSKDVFSRFSQLSDEICFDTI